MVILSSRSDDTAWKDVDWRLVRRNVHNLQIQIYHHAKSGKVSDVHNLQKQLLASADARLLATRKVTQEGNSNKTSGFDTNARLSPGQRYKLAISHLSFKEICASPITGITSIIDRARQALVALALEPEWEAKFEPNSFGFRPGRSVHDAVKKVRTILIHSQKFAYVAHISKCFDHLNHDTLLAKLSQSKQNVIYQHVEDWLKAGVMDLHKGPYPSPNDLETLQGGNISSLLVNIALHALVGERDSWSYS